jgi:hypothetical protein
VGIEKPLVTMMRLTQSETEEMSRYSQDPVEIVNRPGKPQNCNGVWQAHSRSAFTPLTCALCRLTARRSANVYQFGDQPADWTIARFSLT